MILTPLTTIAADADPAFADWTDLDVERAVASTWGQDTPDALAARAEQRRRDAVHDRRANAQAVAACACV